MAFNLYFAGSPNAISEPLFKQLGCHRLMSQLHERNLADKWRAYKVEHPEAVNKLFIDSGAFSAHTKGRVVDVDEYISYLNKYDEFYHIYAQVDKIPGVFRQPKTREELLSAPKESWENYLYMRDKMISPDKLLPIFHQGEHFDWLHNMLEAKFDGKHIPYIGISPANDMSTTEKEKWIGLCFKLIQRSSNPNVMTHAFGMTSLPVLERHPFTSADSTSWIMTGANGNMMTPWGTLVLSAKAKSDPKHIMNQPKWQQEVVDKYAKERGYSLEQCIHDYKARIAVNIHFLQEWANSYEYKGRTVSKNFLF